jgi:hypothetical protein
MTRFDDYIITEDRESKILEADRVLSAMAPKIRRQCRKWLTEIKKCGEYLTIWRGVDSTDNWIYKKVRTNREPTDMPLDIHYEIDESFYKKFGWKPRSEGMFVFPRQAWAFGYGTGTYLVFPVRYQGLVWSPVIGDLYLHRKNWKDFIDTYTDKNLCKALKSKRELMINCDLYYGINDKTLWYSSYSDGKLNHEQIANKYIEEELL